MSSCMVFWNRCAVKLIYEAIDEGSDKDKGGVWVEMGGLSRADYCLRISSSRTFLPG